MERIQYYPGTEKKITDPFVRLSCSCGNQCWAVLSDPLKCRRCGDG